MRGRRLSLAAAVVVLGALVFATGAQACSCAQTSPAEAIRRADAAIVGRLVEVVPRDGLRADFRYRVKRVYKGGEGIRLGRVIAVSSAMQGAACGLPQSVGRRYGLLLAEDEGGWSSGLCGVLQPQVLASPSGRVYHCAS